MDGYYSCSSCGILIDYDGEPPEEVPKYHTIFACIYVCAKCSSEGVTTDNLHKLTFKQHIPDFFKQGKHREQRSDTHTDTDTDTVTDLDVSESLTENDVNELLVVDNNKVQWTEISINKLDDK